MEVAVALLQDWPTVAFLWSNQSAQSDLWPIPVCQERVPNFSHAHWWPSTQRFAEWSKKNEKKEQLYVKSCSALGSCTKYVGLAHARGSAQPVGAWHKMANCLSSYRVLAHNSDAALNPMAEVRPRRYFTQHRQRAWRRRPSARHVLSQGQTSRGRHLHRPKQSPELRSVRRCKSCISKCKAGTAAAVCSTSLKHHQHRDILQLDGGFIYDSTDHFGFKGRPVQRLFTAIKY